MADLIGEGLGSPDIWLIPSLILAALGLLITFNSNVRSLIGEKIKIVNEKSELVGILFVALAAFVSSSRAFYFRRKMESDLVGTYGCERTLFYDCRDLIFASSLPLAMIWLGAASLVIWYIVTMFRDYQDNLALAAQNLLPISLFIIVGLSLILLVINYFSNGIVLAPYTLANIVLLALSGWMIRSHLADEVATD